MENNDYVTITLISTVVSTVEVPTGLENEDELREYLHRAYSNSELIDDTEDVTIEEIEDYSYPRDEFDECDTRWHGGDFE